MIEINAYTGARSKTSIPWLRSAETTTFLLLSCGYRMRRQNPQCLKVGLHTWLQPLSPCVRNLFSTSLEWTHGM